MKRGSMGGYGEIKVAHACLSLLIVMSVMVALAAAAPRAEAVISCDQVLNSVSACLGFLQRGGAVAPACCDGVKSLAKAAAATADLQAVCSCTKSLQPRVEPRQSLLTPSTSNVLPISPIPTPHPSTVPR